MTTQDPELSAALGWPGGIIDPVLDRTRLLQMVAALRLASQQALEALEYATPTTDWTYIIDALRAALAQEQAEPDLSRCPQCNGPADNGFDRSFPPSPYLCTKCMAEPVEPVAWQCQEHGDTEWFDCSKESYGINPRRYTYRALYTAPPRRTMVPLTDEEILAAVGWERAEMYMKLTPNFPVDEAKKETLTNARAIEKASWEKNK